MMIRTTQAASVLACCAFFCLASPCLAATTPQGFGAGTTGGAGGEVVRVTTRTQLEQALCRSHSPGGACNDNAPRIVELATTIDYTNTEGRSSGVGCYPYKACAAPYKPESLVLLNERDTHCAGKPLTQIAYDSAGKHPLDVGSNKTLIGIGAGGTLKGKGLRLHGAKNVIIRNLTLSDINEGIVFAGDAISLDDADHVWIDHNRFQRIGRQMIVDGFGPATNVTISWNDFDGNSAYSSGCNGKHYWNVLLDAAQQTVTVSNNWFHAFAGRAPRIVGDAAFLHLVNNLFQDGSWHALDADQPANVLMEGNVFENVDTPITRTTTAHVFGALDNPDASAQAQCQASLGRDCVGNLAGPVPAFNGFRQDSAVLQALRAIAPARIVTPDPADKVAAAVKANAGPGHL